MQELLIVNPSERGARGVVYDENPKRPRRSGRRASAKQLAWRKTFAARYGGGKRRRASNPKSRRKLMASVKRGGRKVSRRAWRASGYHRNPMRRSYRRNPIAVRASLKSITSLLIESAQGAAGATLIDMAMGQIVVRGWLPANMLTNTTYPLVKGGVAIGLGVVVGMLPLPPMLKRFAVEGVKGSLICTLRDTVAPYISGNFPLGRRMGYAMPGRVLNGRRPMGEYLHGNGAKNDYMPLWQREQRQVYPSYGGLGEYLNH